ncbi:unnamed protein product, partial [Pylaiella littoralis]
ATGLGAKSLAALAGLTEDQKDEEAKRDDRNGSDSDSSDGDIDVTAVVIGAAEFDELPLLVTPTHRERAILGSDGCIGADGGWRLQSSHVNNTVKANLPPPFSAPPSVPAGGSGTPVGIVARVSSSFGHTAAGSGKSSSNSKGYSCNSSSSSGISSSAYAGAKRTIPSTSSSLSSMSSSSSSSSPPLPAMEGASGGIGSGESGGGGFSGGGDLGS